MDELVYRKAKKQQLELIGKKFGRLTVVNLVGFKSKKRGSIDIHEPVYALICDCGKELIRTRREFKYGNTRSCGCLRQEVVYEKFSNNRSISDILFYKTQLYNKYIHSANRRGIEFKLDFEVFNTITASNCHYCGAKPKTGFKYKSNHNLYFYNGVDRYIDNEGYTEENSVPCCTTCNFLKGNLDGFDFVAAVEKIHSHCSFSQQCGSKNWAKSVEPEIGNTEVTVNVN